MRISEVPLLIACSNDELVGILSVPEQLANSVGVLIVVGGPQYRAGSHRQFVLLARHLAGDGIACMRFDYRGMGDATGEQRTFEGVGEDIKAAADHFLARVPALKRIVLWGLCDGASAACFYAPLDARVSGMILVNPWVRTQGSEAKTMLKHHYLRRLLDRRFWKKLVGGRVAIATALRGVAGAVGVATSRGGLADAVGSRDVLPDRMARGLEASGAPFALALSGRDYVAREFEQIIAEGGDWAALARGRQCLALERLPHADHTFSSAEWRHAIARLSSRLVGHLSDRPSGDVK